METKIIPIKQPQAVTQNPFTATLPSTADGTDVYAMAPVNYSHAPLKTVPDLTNGAVRNKRWGAVFSIGVLPGLDKQPSGPAVLPLMPSQFFDSDDLAALRARLIHELDKALELAQLQLDNPELYQKYENEFYTSLQQPTRVK